MVRKKYKQGDTYEGEKLEKGVKIKTNTTKNKKRVVKKYKTSGVKKKEVTKYKGKDGIFDAEPNKRVSNKQVSKIKGKPRKVRKTK